MTLSLVPHQPTPHAVHVISHGKLGETCKMAMEPTTPLQDYVLGEPVSFSFLHSPSLMAELEDYDLCPKGAVVFGSYQVFMSGASVPSSSWEDNLFVVPLPNGCLRIRMHVVGRYFFRATIVDGEQADRLFKIDEDRPAYPWLRSMFGEQHHHRYTSRLSPRGTLACGLRVFHTATAMTVTVRAK